MPDYGLWDIMICWLPALVFGILIIAIIVNRMKQNKAKSMEPGENNQKDVSSPSLGSDDVFAIPSTQVRKSDTVSQMISLENLKTGTILLGISTIVVFFIDPRVSYCLGTISIINALFLLIRVKQQGAKGNAIAIIAIVLGLLPFILTLLSLIVMLSPRNM